VRSPEEEKKKEEGLRLHMSKGKIKQRVTHPKPGHGEPEEKQSFASVIERDP